LKIGKAHDRGDTLTCQPHKKRAR